MQTKYMSPCTQAVLFDVHLNSPSCFWFTSVINVTPKTICHKYQPATVTLCHGKKNMTRPSLVEGSSSPMLSGLKRSNS